MAEFMTVEELSDYLRVNKKTVYRMLDQNKIPALRIGHQWRFDKAIIDDWLRQHSSSEGATILVIDNEEIIGILFREILEKLKYEVIAVQDGLQGLELIKRIDFDMVFLDLKMQGLDGVEVFRNIKS
ncbi:helix-turn-helix domain-containing protein, partial [Chloroflexota bacterium]